MVQGCSASGRVLGDDGRGDHLREYTLYGLRVRSEVPLPASICQRFSPWDDHDIELRWGERTTLPDRPPSGRVVAELVPGHGRGYVLVDAGTGYALRFHGTCQFWIARDLRSVWVHLPPEVAPDLAALLFVGNVLACILTLAGEYVLHASAVEVGNVALAFVGGSGMGKSTLAALLCASGARLIADDLLRLQPQGRRFLCYPGAGEIRLRQQAAELARGLPALASETTADGRVGVKLDHPGSRPALGAIVIPRPSRQCHAVRLERLTCSSALLLLMTHRRVQGLRQVEHVQAQFQQFAHVTASVPVFEAEIPWGPPFSPAIAEELLQGVGLVVHQTETDAIRSRG